MKPRHRGRRLADTTFGAARSRGVTITETAAEADARNSRRFISARLERDHTTVNVAGFDTQHKQSGLGIAIHFTPDLSVATGGLKIEEGRLKIEDFVATDFMSGGSPEVNSVATMLGSPEVNSVATMLGSPDIKSVATFFVDGSGGFSRGKLGRHKECPKGRLKESLTIRPIPPA